MNHQKKKRSYKILLIKLREVGDLLLTTPVVNAIKKTSPDSQVSFLVNSGTEGIVTDNPHIAVVHIFDRATKKLPWLEKIKKQIQFAWSIRKEKFDIVFDFTGGDRAAIYTFLSGAKNRISFNFNQGFIGKKYIYTRRIPLPSSPLHEVEKNISLVKPFGFNINAQEKSPEIFFSKDDATLILSLFKNQKVRSSDLKIHIHPTSKWLFKCWVDSYFAQLIDTLTETYEAKIFLTSGISQKEKNKAKSIFTCCKNKPVNLIGWGTLKHLAALSKSCDLFIGIDTGPMHIAAAIKTPVIALFGPSDPIKWSPWGEDHIIVRSTKHDDCMPCEKDGCNGTKISQCLESITVDMVKNQADNLIKKYYNYLDA